MPKHSDGPISMIEHPIVAIGDVHGQLGFLEQALEWIAQDADAQDAAIVFLGDYVDRGLDSKGVIDAIMDLQLIRDVTCLRGNHEDEMLRFLNSDHDQMPKTDCGKMWLSDGGGGRQTLLSYGVHGNTDHDFRDLQVRARDAIPDTHLDFLSRLRHSYETDSYFFAHAGIRPGIPFSEQDPDDLIWIRDPFLSATVDHGKTVIHGHTPISFPAFYGNRVNCDGGAAFGRAVHPILLQNGTSFALGPNGRVALSKQS